MTVYRIAFRVGTVLLLVYVASFARFPSREDSSNQTTDKIIQ